MALVSLLVCGLAPTAMARPDAPLHPQLAAAVPARPGNGPSDRSSPRGAPASLRSETIAVEPHSDDRLALAREFVATTTPPPGRTAPDEPPRLLDTPIAPALLTTTAAMGGGYVDPAGGHPVVRPIETSSPYRAR